MLFKTEAIILRVSNYRAKSKLVTLFTKSHGKIRCIAKGVRDTKTKWGGVLQSMAYINAVIYYKENRTLHTLSQAEYVQHFSSIYSEFEKTETAYRIVDILNKTTIESNPNAELFVLAADILKRLDRATKNYINLFFFFEYRLASILGFGISPSNEEETFNGVRERNSTEYKTGLDLLLKSLLTQINSSNLCGKKFSMAEVNMLDKFFINHFRQHIEDFKSYKLKLYSGTKEFYTV